ncbi:MAG TPA: hypothetical protein VF821_24615, partial [Lentzea sp.]
MSLLNADSFVVDHPYNFLSLMSRPHYRVQVFNEHDMPLAAVSELSGPGLQRPLRHTSFNGWSSYDLVVVAPDGQPLIHIRKPFGRKPRIQVTTPNGHVIGSLQRQTNRLQALLDANGRQLCVLGDVIHIQIGHRAKRNGKRVRRDVVRIRPGVAEPVRSLAIAGALVFDIVRGAGTGRI